MVTFNGLSWPLKTAVIVSWIFGILGTIEFIIGFISVY